MLISFISLHRGCLQREENLPNNIRSGSVEVGSIYLALSMELIVINVPIFYHCRRRRMRRSPTLRATKTTRLCPYGVANPLHDLGDVWVDTCPSALR